MASNYYDLPDGNLPDDNSSENSSGRMTPLHDRNNSGIWSPTWSSARAPLTPPQSCSELPAPRPFTFAPTGSHTPVTLPSTPLRAPPSSPVPGSPPSIPLSSANVMCASHVFNFLPLYLEQYPGERSSRTSTSSDAVTPKETYDLLPFVTDRDEGLDNPSTHYLYTASPSSLGWQTSHSRGNSVDLSSSSSLYGSTLRECQNGFDLYDITTPASQVSTSPSRLQGNDILRHPQQCFGTCKSHSRSGGVFDISVEDYVETWDSHTLQGDDSTFPSPRYRSRGSSCWSRDHEDSCGNRPKAPMPCSSNDSFIAFPTPNIGKHSQGTQPIPIPLPNNRDNAIPTETSAFEDCSNYDDVSLSMGKRLRAFTSKHNLRNALSSSSQDMAKSSVNKSSSIKNDDKHRTGMGKGLHAIGSKFDVRSAFHRGQKDASQANQGQLDRKGRVGRATLPNAQRITTVSINVPNICILSLSCEWKLHRK
jgi:hypothetical protein